MGRPGKKSTLKRSASLPNWGSPKGHCHLCGVWSSDDQQAFCFALPTRSVAIQNLSPRAHVEAFREQATPR